MKLTKSLKNALTKHFLEVVGPGIAQQTPRISFYRELDKVLYGDVEDLERHPIDKLRAEKKSAGLLTAAPDQLLRVGEGELARLVNDVTAVVMPVDVPYNAVTAPDQADKAQAIMTILRTYAARHGHRTEFLLAVKDLLAYGTTALEVAWKPAPEGGVVLRTLDLYNLIYDRTVPFRKIPTSGEFFGWNEPISYVELRRLLRTQDAVTPSADAPGLFSFTYYEKTHRKTSAKPSKPRTLNGPLLYGDLARLFNIPVSATTAGFLKTIIYARVFKDVIPQLPELDALLRLTIVNGHLVLVENLGPESTPMPVVCGSWHGDRGTTEGHTYGEHAAELTAFMSVVFNLENEAMRRSASGAKIIVDERVINTADIEDLQNPVKTVIPAKIGALAGQTSLAQAIAVVPATPVNSRLGPALQMHSLLRESIFPQSRAGDIMSLDRATAVHATLAASMADVSLLSVAILVDDAIGVPMRMAIRNSLLANYTADNELVDRMARLTDIELSSLKFALIAAQPVVGFDRSRVIAVLRELINMLLQTPQLAANPAALQPLLNYFVSLASAGVLNMQDLGLNLAPAAIGAPPEGALNA